MNALQPETKHVSTNLTTSMRTLVGVDGAGLYRPALAMLGHLRFAENHIALAHAGSAVGPQFNPAPPEFAFLDQVGPDSSPGKAGEILLDEASALATHEGLGPSIEKIFRVGGSSATLMKLAEEQRSDLVAIGSGEHGAIGSFFLGSVGRAFAIGGRQSLLVVRKSWNVAGHVRAVFATDHSEYADKCFSRLLQMNPEGLRHVTIVTAMKSIIDAREVDEMGDTDGDPYALTAAEDGMRSRGEAMVDRLRVTGRTAEFRLVEGAPFDGLRRVMEDTGAELLILGARGHGLIERVFIGSLALHAVVAGPYSVLVLRMPEED